MAAEKKLIRIGKVSSVNYAQGMIRVTYPDRDDSVTAEIPVFSFTDEYKMPKVGSQVLVLHLSNGAAAGVCMGHYWNEKNISKATGAGVFRKELASEYGEAFFEYKDGKLTIYADQIEIKAKSSVKEIAPAITHDGPVKSTKNIEATDDVVGSGISLSKHTHTGVHGETSTPH